MEGTTRCFNPETAQNLTDIISRVAKNTAASYRAEAEVEHTLLTPPLINDPEVSGIARGSVAKLYGKEAVADMEKVMGGEDFAFYTKAAPGAVAFVGIANSSKGTDVAHHNERFDIDEDALPVGTALTRLRWISGGKCGLSYSINVYQNDKCYANRCAGLIPAEGS